jgi:hypothetical protein
LRRERDKRNRTIEIERAEHEVAIERAERKRDAEWTASVKSLQKQLREEQSRVAQMLLDRRKSERTYENRELEQKLALAREQASRKLAEDGHKVIRFKSGRLVPLFMICFLFCCANLFTRPP